MHAFYCLAYLAQHIVQRVDIQAGVVVVELTGTVGRGARVALASPQCGRIDQRAGAARAGVAQLGGRHQRVERV